jgi:hypothetical protein
MRDSWRNKKPAKKLTMKRFVRLCKKYCCTRAVRILVVCEEGTIREGIFPPVFVRDRNKDREWRQWSYACRRGQIDTAIDNVVAAVKNTMFFTKDLKLEKELARKKGVK